MCIACLTGLISAGGSLTAAKGASAYLGRRHRSDPGAPTPARRRRSRVLRVGLVVLAIVAAALVPVSVGGAAREDDTVPPAAQVAP